MPSLRHVAAILAFAGWFAHQAASAPTPREARDQAEARWQQRKPQAYEFSIDVRCFCGELLGKPVAFRVRGSDARPVQELAPASREIYGYYDTIEKLFGVIRLRARGADKAVIEYDPDLGYPVRADIDPNKNTFDDELWFTVGGFRKIE